jgi:hypothetical protein
MIKKFKDFDINESEDYQNLSDLEAYTKDIEKDEVEKLDLTEWNIVEIIDIIRDPKDVEELENQLKEANIGFNLNADMTSKDLKRGDIIYLTAMLQSKNKSTAYSPGTQGVIKCRITDLYFGLEKLKYLK